MGATILFVDFAGHTVPATLDDGAPDPLIIMEATDAIALILED